MLQAFPDIAPLGFDAPIILGDEPVAKILGNPRAFKLTPRPMNTEPLGVYWEVFPAHVPQSAHLTPTTSLTSANSYQVSSTGAACSSYSTDSQTFTCRVQFLFREASCSPRSGSLVYTPNFATVDPRVYSSKPGS
ncbi:hypothetical protein OPQ81_003830 [Rhizoctonia solani]|nr:hypothetical protein OPQ81_003830 [Rhizoctonia solani]